MIQAQTRGQVLEGVQQYGLAPGARKMIDAEEKAAQMAMETGIYGVWRSSKGTDCTRIAPTSRCFCNHSYAEHFFVSPKSPYPTCKACSCRAFAFVPSRPEEVGDWWLPRRKGFNVHTWRAKCRCGHGHDEHDPNARRCRCGCPAFQSNFACLVCDLKWEDHETVFETATERLMAGRPVGDDFRPLADDASMRDLVFPAGGPSSGSGPGRHGAATADAFAPCSLRRAQVPASQGEKAVRIMAASSGGAVADQPLANRWGKVANPPAWPPSRPDSQLGPASPAGGRGGTGSSGTILARRPEVGSAAGVGAASTRGGGAAAGTDYSGSMSMSSEAGRRPASSGSGSRPGSSGSRVGAGAGAGVVGPVAGTGARPGSVGRRPPSGTSGTSGGLGRAPSGAGMAGVGRAGAGAGAGTGPSGPKQLSSGFRPVYD